jgi:hypothetical protein
LRSYSKLALHQRCRTVVAACTGESRQARLKAIVMHGSMATIPQRQSRCGELSADCCQMQQTLWSGVRSEARITRQKRRLPTAQSLSLREGKAPPSLYGFAHSDIHQHEKGADRSRRPILAKCPQLFDATATYCAHSNRTPSGVPAHGSTMAATIDHVIASPALVSDFRDHAVRLMKRHGRHGLRRRCEGQGKGSNCYQSDHFGSPL